MSTITTEKHIGVLGRSILLQEVLKREELDIGDGGNALILDVKDGKGWIVENVPYLIIDAVENLLPDKRATLKRLSVHTREQELTIVLEFHDFEEYLEISLFDNRAEMLNFLDEADLSNKWIVS